MRHSYEIGTVHCLLQPVLLHCARDVAKCLVQNHQGPVLDGDQCIFIQQYDDIMSVNVNVVIISDVGTYTGLSACVCMYAYACAAATTTKTKFHISFHHYIICKTVSIRITEAFSF